MTVGSLRGPLGPVTLAFDHVKAMQACISGDPSARDLGAIKAQLAEVARGAVLTDPEHNLAGVKSCLDADQQLVVSIEDGDYASPELAPRMLDGWNVSRAVEAGADVIKCFFWYETGTGGEEARKFLDDIAQQCHAADIALLAEPILVGEPGPGHISRLIETVEELTLFGASALKLEFPGGPRGDSAASFDACSALTEASTLPWYLLSAGVSYEMFQEQLAAAVAGGAAGCVVGRAVWGDLIDGNELTGEAQELLGVRLDALHKIVAANRPSQSTESDN